MQILVNGKSLEFDSPPSGAELLARLNVVPATVVAELNGEIIKREEFLAQTLADGDVLELVTVVGGG
jgi:thiamine biosynthesis protein ThiS